MVLCRQRKEDVEMARTRNQEKEGREMTRAELIAEYKAIEDKVTGIYWHNSPEQQAGCCLLYERQWMAREQAELDDRRKCVNSFWQQVRALIQSSD